MPSDFQDYTLVVVVAVAAHLMAQPLGQGAGLERLARRYGHDLKSLDQVGWVGGGVGCKGGQGGVGGMAVVGRRGGGRRGGGRCLWLWLGGGVAV